MLYNKPWDDKVDADNPFTVEAIIAWLETMPPLGRYDWADPQRCLACQYYQSIGIARPWTVDETLGYIRAFGDHETYFFIAAKHPHTFGAALKRARALRGNTASK